MTDMTSERKDHNDARKRGAIVNTASCAGLGCPTMMTGYATRSSDMPELTPTEEATCALKIKHVTVPNLRWRVVYIKGSSQHLTFCICGFGLVRIDGSHVSTLFVL